MDWSPIVGYDFFISYKRGDGSPYARSLKERLGSAGFQCFLDDDDAPAGESLTPAIQRGLRRSRAMVVLCTEAALASSWVAQEVATFARIKGNRFLPVSFERSLERVSLTDTPLAPLTGGERIWLEESHADSPSDAVIRGIEAQFRYHRANRLRAGFLLLIALLLSLAAGIAIRQWQVVIGQRLVVERRAAEANDQILASYVEHGRQELYGGQPLRALPYLSAAYSLGKPSTSLRFMLAQAISPVDALLSTLRHSGVDHPEPIEFVAFGKDGSRVVSSSLDGTVEVWDTARGRSVGKNSGHKKEWQAQAIAISPDGTRLVTAGAINGVILWKIAPNAFDELDSPDWLDSDEGAVHFVSFSPDGRQFVTAGDDGTARVWDATTHKRRFVLQHTGPVSAATFSPDGKLVATASRDKTAKIWDAATGACLHTLIDHAETVLAVAFSNDAERIVTASEDTKAKVWFTATGKLHRTLRHSNSVVAASFSPDGARVLTGSWDGTARIWDAEKGTSIRILKGHEKALAAASFSPDGTRVVTASWDETAKIWDAITGDLLLTLAGHTGSLWAAVFSRDGARVATAGNDGTAKVWLTAPARVMSLWGSETKEAHSVAFSADGKTLVAGMANGEIRICDAIAGKVLRALTPAHTEPVSATAISPEGKWILTGSSDHTAKIWEAATGALKSTLQHKSPVDAVAFRPDGKAITVQESGTVTTWDIGGTVLNEDSVPSFRGAAFSADGAWLVIVSKDTAIVRTTTGGATSSTWQLPSPQAIAISPDGQSVVTTSSDNIATVWETATGKIRSGLLFDRSDGLDFVARPTFSRDGTMLVTGDRAGAMTVWETATGRPLTSFAASESMRSAAFSPDGTRLATANYDGARVWTLALETRSADEIALLTRCRVPWQLVEGHVVPFVPDQTACPTQTASATPPATLPAGASRVSQHAAGVAKPSRDASLHRNAPLSSAPVYVARAGSTYHTTDDAIDVALPEGWRVDSSGIGDTLAIFYPNRDGDASRDAGISLFSRRVPRATLEQLVSGFKRRSQILGQKQKRVDGELAYELSVADPKSRAHGTALITLFDNNEYIFAFYTSDQQELTARNAELDQLAAGLLWRQPDRIYRSNDGALTLEYPRGWQPLGRYDGKDRFVIIGPVDHGIASVIAVSRLDRQGLTLQKFARRYARQSAGRREMTLVKLSGGTRYVTFHVIGTYPTNQEERQLSDHPSHVLLFEIKTVDVSTIYLDSPFRLGGSSRRVPDLRDFRVMQTLVVAGNYIYVFSLSSLKTSFRVCRPIFERVLQTVHWL